MRVWTMIGLIAVALGCAGRDESLTDKQPSESQESHRTDHAAAPKHDHPSPGGHGDGAADTPRKLVIGTDPMTPRVGSPVKLVLQIQNVDGTPVKQFDVIHEKLVHLILVREGLDVFDHLHPEVDPSGMITVDYRFPKSGTYYLFADHQPEGEAPGMAEGSLNIGGQDERAAALIPNSSPAVTMEDLKAYVTLQEDGGATNVFYRITDAADEPVTDLQPYLGAMGHLVIISADGREYVHAHPASDEMKAPSGTVSFVAHFRKPGIYKAWGQFQRQGSVFTVPFVIERKSGQPKSHVGEH